MHADQTLEQLEVVAVQLDETANMIETGRPAGLRVALLLVDNAIELIMHRQITRELQFNHIYERYSKLQRLPLHEDLVQRLGAYVDKARRRKLARAFPEKVSFLLERNVIDSATAGCITRLHKYRNEAQHDDILRADILLPAVRIYFDIACMLLAEYNPRIVFFPALLDPDEQRRSFIATYPTVAKYSFARSSLTAEAAVARNLRARLEIDIEILRRDLAAYLLKQLDEMDEDLDFVMAPSPWIPGASRADMLNFAELALDNELNRLHDRNHGWLEDANDEEGDETLPVDIEALLVAAERIHSKQYRYRLEDFVRWRAEIEALSGVDSRRSLFEAFTKIELDIEPIHAALRDMSSAYDRIVQDEVERIRGK